MNYIGFTLILVKTNRIMENITTIKTTENLWKISNDLDKFIESMVWSGERRGKDIKVIQGILKRLDKEIDNFNG